MPQKHIMHAEERKNLSVAILLSGNTINIEKTSLRKHFLSQWKAGFIMDFYE
jgi:hypothetical protein